jgi:nicotinate-nucleotide pyrophosphorylase (carboxylating)
MKLPSQERIDKIIRDALAEDIGAGDATGLAMGAGPAASADIIAKDRGVLAGVRVARRVFQVRDPVLEVECCKRDGQWLSPGETVLKVRGGGASILAAERTALNILGRMCGIATLAKRYVREVEGTTCRIFDTRKTMPGLRVLDKCAVTCGGAENHRFGLYDMILVKENHIRWAGGIRRALQRAADYAAPRDLRVETEVTSLEEYGIALEYPVDIIMLDHFSLNELKSAVNTEHGSILLEASGDIDLGRVRAVAETGVDIISVGELTHSAPAFDLSLLFHVS